MTISAASCKAAKGSLQMLGGSLLRASESCVRWGSDGVVRDAVR